MQRVRVAGVGAAGCRRVMLSRVRLSGGPGGCVVSSGAPRPGFTLLHVL